MSLHLLDIYASQNLAPVVSPVHVPELYPYRYTVQDPAYAEVERSLALAPQIEEPMAIDEDVIPEFPLQVTSYQADFGGEFHVFRDDLVIGGTKTRALLPFIGEQASEQAYCCHGIAKWLTASCMRLRQDSVSKSRHQMLYPRSRQ